jgi:PiT family inorganic phosphate transporter
MPELLILIVSIILALGYAYANGMNDAANTVATVISTRALTPLVAVIMGGTLNLAGAFFGAIVGTAVAKTIGKGIIPSEEMTQYAVISAIAASVIWVFFATRLGFPVSVSHSLIAAVVGAGAAIAGFGALNGAVLTKVLLALAFSPILGFLGGFTFMVMLFWLLRRRSPASVNAVGSKIQILAAAFLSFSHGRNDSQNAIGIIALAWTVYQTQRLGTDQELDIAFWMVTVSAVTIGLGTAIGGWRVIRTLGMRITRLEPIGGATANITAAGVIEAATILGLPVSTTHTSASAIIGVGATRRFSAVRWGVTGSMGMAWLVTYPICLTLGYGISKTLQAVT